MAGNSKFRRQKRRKRFDGGVDRISSLPDDIIVAILSLLSLREAIATSVLSPRWSDLWKHTSNLDFNKTTLNSYTTLPHELWDPNTCKNIVTVNSVLQSYKTHSLKKFIISFYVNKSAQSIVAKWVKFVFSRAVETLEWDFKCDDVRYQIGLAELLRESRICWGRNLIISTSLKRLYFRCLQLSGEDIKLLLREFPLSEMLRISEANFTSDVEVCGPTLALQYLNILHCEDGKSVKVSAPNLTYICVANVSTKVLVENVPKLVWAYFCDVHQYNVRQFTSTLFCCISQIKTLGLALYHPKAFLAHEFPEMPNLKKLVVRYYRADYEYLLGPITTLIWASPRLQEFKMVIEHRIDQFSCKIDIANVKRSPHQHLKVLEFRGFCGIVGHHVDLVRYISKNCLALEKIIIGCKPIFPTTASKADLQIFKDYAKGQLQSEIPDHIQLLFP